MIAETYERGAIVGAVCNGPVSLLNIKLSNEKYLVDGKNITSFTTEEEAMYAIADVLTFKPNYQNKAPFSTQKLLGQHTALQTEIL